MTLALLLTAVTGAWAQGTLNVVELKVPANWEGDNSYMTAADLTGFKTSTSAEALAWTGAPKTGYAMLFYAFDGDVAYYVPFNNGEPLSDSNSSFGKNLLFGYSTAAKLYYTAEAPITVEWDASTKTGNFVMPAFDVEIAPIYAPVAQWAKVENVDQLPKAIEGIFAESTDAIVTAGTVAKIGETEVKQGTVMYAVTPATVTEQPALTAFSATLPTAKDITTAGDVYVWYYIKGADTPQGQTATAENTFNDSEICTTPLTVTVLNNKFDINFKAANANTIEAKKATVKVGETAPEVKEGKLTGVKMNSKVTVTAKDGYKFRKVEVKKGEKLTLTVGDMVLDITGCTTWADVVAKNSDKIEAIGSVVVQKDNHNKYIGPSVTTSSPVDTSVNYQWYEAD